SAASAIASAWAFAALTTVVANDTSAEISALPAAESAVAVSIEYCCHAFAAFNVAADVDGLAVAAENVALATAFAAETAAPLIVDRKLTAC
ncbi:MAG: hypothetical protein ACK55I_09320, partial [bacterium]